MRSNIILAVIFDGCVSDTDENKIANGAQSSIHSEFAQNAIVAMMIAIANGSMLRVMSFAGANGTLKETSQQHQSKWKTHKFECSLSRTVAFQMDARSLSKIRVPRNSCVTVTPFGMHITECY